MCANHRQCNHPSIALFQPEQFQQKAGASAGGAWGSPMATSTQMTGGGGGGGGYAGARQDSGLTPLQQQCLNMISGCPHEQGLNIKEVVSSLLQHGHSDVKIRYAMKGLVENSLVPLLVCCYSTIVQGSV